MADGSNHRGGEGISLFTFGAVAEASLTVEAALAMSVFLFAVMALLSFFFVIRTQIQVQTALEQTGNHLYALPEDASLVTAVLLFQEQLSENKSDVSYIVGGNLGISLAQSSVMGKEPIIDLIAEYRVKLPFFPEGLAELKFVQRSRKHAFGSAGVTRADTSGADPETQYVYVTSAGEVYHADMFCTYIRPVVKSVSFSSIDGLRNQNGGRYIACSFCSTGEELPEVWITSWGDCYHLSEYCRGLWHNVERIARSEAGDRRACSKCAGKAA